MIFSLISDKGKVELIAWRLEKKLRDNWFFMKQEFLAKRFAHPTLSTVKYSLGHLLVIWYSRICFRIDWVHVYKYTKIGRNYIMQRAKTWWTWRVISIIAEKTACSSQDHLHTMKIYNTRPVSLSIEAWLKFCSQRFFLFSTSKLFTYFKVINAFKR